MFLRYTTPDHTRAIDWLRSHGFAYIRGEGFCNNPGDKAIVQIRRMNGRPVWSIAIPYTHKPR